MFLQCKSVAINREIVNLAFTARPGGEDKMADANAFINAYVAWWHEVYELTPDQALMRHKLLTLGVPLMVGALEKIVAITMKLTDNPGFDVALVLAVAWYFGIKYYLAYRSMPERLKNSHALKMFQDYLCNHPQDARVVAKGIARPVGYFYPQLPKLSLNALGDPKKFPTQRFFTDGQASSADRLLAYVACQIYPQLHAQSDTQALAFINTLKYDFDDQLQRTMEKFWGEEN